MKIFAKTFKRKACATLVWFIAVITAFSVIGEPTRNFVYAAQEAMPMASENEALATIGMRGLWVTTAYNLDWPSRQGLSNAELRREADVILDRAAAQGINAIFLQVRPTADAFYPSAIFPWSHLISGEQGVGPANNFDPLEYWISAAHARGMELHAWLNPYRVTFPNQQITDPNRLSENHPARLNPDTVLAHGTSLFFDPGNPAARQIILDGVAELLRNYNLDGIHLDDYFYPTGAFPDGTTFARYGGGLSLYDWRRESVNTLIRDLQTTVRQTRPQARFGVSPTAIWMNYQNDPRGSHTDGSESYHRAFADTRRWVLEGWVDYIVPQIYWPEGYARACYEAVLTWWEDTVRGTNVDLYIGLAPYREVEGRPNWAGETVRQLERNSRSDVVRGSIFFRAQFMNSSVGAAIAEFYSRFTNLPTSSVVQNDEPVISMQNMIVVQPRVGFPALSNASNFYFFGSGAAGVPMFVNGQEITNRTEEGFFSIFLPLVHGENTFTFTQEGQQTITRTLTNNPPAPPAPPATMAVAVTNAFPAANEYARVGTALTLSATAPAGATVTAQIGGQTITLTQATNTSLTATANNVIAARFTASFTLNTTAASDAITDLGRPVYTMTWNGQTRTATAAGSIRQLGFDAPYFAEITSNSVWVFPGATTTGGSHWQAHRGQVDRVAAVSGEWTRLASGGWVENANIRRFRDNNLVPNNSINCLRLLRSIRISLGAKLLISLSI